MLPRADAFDIEKEMRANGSIPPEGMTHSPLYTWTLNGCPVAVADLDSPCYMRRPEKPGAAPSTHLLPETVVH